MTAPLESGLSPVPFYQVRYHSEKAGEENGSFVSDIGYCRGLFTTIFCRFISMESLFSSAIRHFYTSIFGVGRDAHRGYRQWESAYGKETG